jgi:DNA-binding transcriptional regulator YdaS (Cro superfamily)
MNLAEFLKTTTQSAFAARIGVRQSAVSQWLQSRVPAERVRQVVDASSERVTPHELRPDLYPEGFVFPAQAAA